MKHTFTILLLLIILSVIISRKRTLETLLPGRSPLECGCICGDNCRCGDNCGCEKVNQGVSYNSSIRDQISNDTIMPSL